jgi:Protein of unknown function (DUF1587)
MRALTGLILCAYVIPASGQRLAAAPDLVNRYCTGCHNERLKTGNLVLEGVDSTNPGANPGVWERVLRQLRSGLMPPAGLPRPDASTSAAFTRQIETALDRAAAAHPNAGAPMPHRLNRVEYSNAIRDLLALGTHPGAQLPIDDSGNGFDNMADLLSMSPALLERYLLVARRVSRLAVGDPKAAYVEERYSRDRGQPSEPASEELPFNARGGLPVQHYFPLDAEYEFRIQVGRGGDGPNPTPYTLKAPVKAGLHTVSPTAIAASRRRGFTRERR